MRDRHLNGKPDPLPDQVAGAFAGSGWFSAAPGGQQKKKLAELAPLVSDASSQVKKLVDEELPALNKKMNEAGIPHIIPKTEEHRRDEEMARTQRRRSRVARGG